MEASRHGEVTPRPIRAPINGPLVKMIGLVIILALIVLTIYAAWWVLHPLVNNLDAELEDIRDPYDPQGVVPGPGMRLVQYDVNISNSIAADVEVSAYGFSLEHQNGISDHDARISMDRVLVPSEGSATFTIGFEVPEDAATIALLYDDGDRTFIILL